MTRDAVPAKPSTFRRTYKKSTLGCVACKARKIKCDEARPICGNCKKHFIDSSSCRYARETRSSKVALPAPERTGISVTPLTLDATNTLALRLMHHYTVSIGVNSSSSSPKKTVTSQLLWGVEIPCMAFTSDIVMNALLGISAWHLWAMNPLDPSLIVVSRNYFGKTLQLQRAALEQKDDKNIPPIFIAGLILAHHNWLLSHTNDNKEDRHLNLETFHLCNGYRTLSKKLSPTWSEYMALCTPTVSKTYVQLPQNNTFMERVAQDSIHVLQRVQDADIRAEDKEAYRIVIEDIISLYALIADVSEDVTTKENAVVTYLHRAPPSFVHLLEKHEPIAAGLLCRIWVALSLLKDNSPAWYIHGAGNFQVYRLAVWGIQKTVPRESEWIMEWPLKVIMDDF